MARHFIEVRSISDWQSRLGDPELHWKRGASAMELAVSWTLARHSPRGMPASVAALLDSHQALAGSDVAFAVPELRTSLPGGSASSQTDLWALLRNQHGAVSLSVEGKAFEPFGDTVERWLGKDRPGRAPPSGRVERLEFLAAQLGLEVSSIGTLRYQLLHRIVAALLEAERWGASAAVMLVQRFVKPSARPTPSWNDFREFAARVNAVVQPGVITKAEVPGNTALYLAWLDCQMATDEELVSAMTDRPLRPLTRQNAFECLCHRADKEKWCWKLGCTTCGCMHFRYGLTELSQGKHPASSEWLTHKRVQFEVLAQQLGAASFPLPLQSQRECVRIASRARIAAIASNSKFPDWLGYLGIMLDFCRNAETEDRPLTKAWAPQLSDLLPDESSLKRRLRELATGTGTLSLEDLEAVERELQHSAVQNHNSR